jgi:hypothetical protein
MPNIFRLLVFGKGQSQFCPHLFRRGQLRKSYLKTIFAAFEGEIGKCRETGGIVETEGAGLDE